MKTNPANIPNSETERVKRLYTEKVKQYLACNACFRYAQALEAFLERSELLRPGLRILDAGCGTGTASFALMRVLGRKGFSFERIDGFDLTPAMLERFRQQLGRSKVANVRLCEANVLELETLPNDWTNYDLVISAGMLEYVPRVALPRALATLRQLVAPDGRLLVFISRKTWLTTMLIERYWRANRYSRDELRYLLGNAGFTGVVFKRFPSRYFWQNIWGHIIEASATQNAAVAPPQGLRKTVSASA